MEDMFRSIFRFLRLMFHSGAAVLCLVIALASPARSETLVRAGPDVTDDLNSYRNLRQVEEQIHMDMREGLVTIGPNGGIAPGLAESWNFSPDGLTATFILRRNAKWSDGTPIIAAHFVRGFKDRVRLFKLGAAKGGLSVLRVAGVREYLEGQTDAPDGFGIRALSDHQLEIRLNQPDIFFIDNMRGTEGILPMHPDWIMDPDVEYMTPSPTDGPYVPVEFRPNAYLRLIKNEFYHDAENIVFDEVIYLNYNRYEGNIYSDILAGKLSFVARPRTNMVAWFRENHPEWLKRVQLKSLSYLDINFRNPELAKHDIREALELAIDRDAIYSILNSQHPLSISERWFPPGGNPLPPTDFAFSTLPYDERLEAARALMRKNGYDQQRPLELTLRTNGSFFNRSLSLALTGMWQQVGFKINRGISQVELELYTKHLFDGDFDLALVSWAGTTPDLGFYIDMAHSDPGIAGAFNYGRYYNPVVDRELSLALDATSIEAKNGHLVLAERTLLEDHGKIPLANQNTDYIVSPRLNGFESGSYGVFLSRYLSFR